MEKKDFYGFSKKKTATVYIEFVKKFSWLQFWDIQKCVNKI